MRLKILHHGNCFDGCASAAFLARFLRARAGAGTLVVDARPVQHVPGDPFEAEAFDGDLNAVVDFRYSASPRLDWWFDHHRTAFVHPSDREHFEADRGGQRFWDPAAPSCTGFVAQTVRTRFGFEAPDLAELVRWADVIDAAAFPSAEVAVKLDEPALRIMTWLEAAREPGAQARLVDALQRMPLSAVAAEPWVAGPLAPLLESHFRSIDGVRAATRLDGDVALVDLARAGIEAGNKFIVYWLFPQTRYNVVVSEDARRTKVAVGSNPWARPDRVHDISQICARYGGGGHPVVGAVTLPPGRVDEARRIAGEIVALLQAPAAAA